MINKPFLSSFNTEIPFQPWFFFFIFLVSNSLLSYFALSVSTNLWISALGLLIPFSIALKIQLDNRLKRGVFPQEFSIETFSFNRNPHSYPLVLTIFLFVLVFTRFFHMTTLPFWPLSDEGTNAFRAMDLMKKWDWSPLWGEWRNESLLVWLLALFFKLIGPSLFALRLFTTIVSLLTSVLSYWAARQFLSRPFALVFSWFLAFSMPQLMLARQCSPNDLIPPFQFLAFGLLGLLIKANPDKNDWKPLMAIGICCGLGFYAYVNWAVICFYIALVLLIYVRQISRLLVFTLIVFLLTLPLIWSRLQPGALGQLNPVHSFNAFINSVLLYGEGLFWHGFPSYPLGPSLGGLLDPVSESLLMIGLLWIIRFFNRSWILLITLGVFFSLLPGILTPSMELQRITPLTPWLMGMSTVGCFCLVGSGGKFNGARLALLLFTFLFINIYNLAFSYCDISKVPPNQQWRNVQYYNAFQIMNELQKNTGPLYVFSEFNPDYDNKGLNVACYPFDALQNPFLSMSRPKWAALIINRHYAPYLINLFPGTKFAILKTDKPPPDGPTPFGIILIPVNQISPSVLMRWIQSDNIHRQVNLAITDRNTPYAWGTYVEPLRPLVEIAKDDRFLTGVYWEKVAFLQTLNKDFELAAKSYGRSIEEGYPMAHLYYNMGICLHFCGKNREAEEANRKAILLEKKVMLKPDLHLSELMN